MGRLVARGVAQRQRDTLGRTGAEDADPNVAPLPKPGNLTVLTLFSGQPVCVIETLDVRIVPFCEVDAAFAATEGEGDGSLAYWRQAHTAFFERECQRIGREFMPDAPVVCERFALVYPSAGQSPI